jgi:hypothetical protein
LRAMEAQPSTARFHPREIRPRKRRDALALTGFGNYVLYRD